MKSHNESALWGVLTRVEKEVSGDANILKNNIQPIYSFMQPISGCLEIHLNSQVVRYRDQCEGKADVELGERLFKMSNIYNIPLSKDAHCLRESEYVIIYTL